MGNDVVFEFGETQVTSRELLVSFIVVAAFVVSSFFIRGCISDKSASIVHELSITTEVTTSPMFKWVRNTGFGRFVGHDTLSTDYPVGIDGVYGLAVKRVLEVYTMHTEYYDDCDSKGRCTTRTRIYWSWDEEDSDYVFSKHVKFFGVEDAEFVNVIPRTRYVKNVRISGDKRYVYYNVPSKVHGVLNGRIGEQYFHDLEFSEGCESVEKWKEDKLKNYGIAENCFIAVWTMLCIASVFVLWRGYWEKLEN